MTQKERIDELERRVRELEARPVYVPVPYVPYPEYPTRPPYIGDSPWRQGWPEPIITFSTGGPHD